MMNEDVGLITGQNNWLIVKEMSKVNKNKISGIPPLTAQSTRESSTSQWLFCSIPFHFLPYHLFPFLTLLSINSEKQSIIFWKKKICWYFRKLLVVCLFFNTPTACGDWKQSAEYTYAHNLPVVPRESRLSLTALSTSIRFHLVEKGYALSSTPCFVFKVGEGDLNSCWDRGLGWCVRAKWSFLNESLLEARFKRSISPNENLSVINIILKFPQPLHCLS